MRQLPRQVGSKNSGHDISRYAKETIGSTAQPRTFILVASPFGGLLQNLHEARQRIISIWVQARDQVGRTTHFREADRSHVGRERDKPSPIKRSGCSLDFVWVKASGFSDDALVYVDVARVDAPGDFAQHGVVARDPDIIEMVSHGVIVAGAADMAQKSAFSAGRRESGPLRLLAFVEMQRLASAQVLVGTSGPGPPPHDRADSADETTRCGFITIASNT